MTTNSREKKKLTKEQIQKAKEVNLVDYCLTNNIPLLRTNTKNPSLAEHDSLVFYPDNKDRQWNRHSTGQGGDAIDFIQFYDSRHLPEGEKVSFQYAVNKLLKNDYESVPIVRPPVPEFEYQNYEVKDFTKAKEYLVNERGINEAFVSVLIDEGIIAQNNRNNIVFKWIDHDQDGKIVGANEQGTEKTKQSERSFKKTQRHSTRGKGFNLRIGEPKNVKFFESAIDLLSYADIHQEQLENEWLVSMEGLKNTVVMETLNSCSRYCQKHNDYHIESVSFCVDNDKAGKEFADKYVGKLSIIDPSGNKPFTLDVPKNTKDWNDELLFLKENGEKNLKMNNQLVERAKEHNLKFSSSTEHDNLDSGKVDILLSREEDNFSPFFEKSNITYDELDDTLKNINNSLVNEKGEVSMSNKQMYVQELNDDQIKEIESSLREAITDIGLYTESEIEENVQRGLDSKVHDLKDTIPVYEILKEGKENMEETHIYIYSGFGEPEKAESFEEITIESNHLGDMTEEFQEEVDWHMEVDTLEEMQENQFFAEYGVWINPTKKQLEEYNDSIGLDKDEYFQDFEGHEQLFEDRETYLDLDDELEL